MDWLFRNEKIRFILAGGTNTLLDFLLLNVLVFAFNTYVLFANIISVSIGITISYFLNHYFVFRSTTRINIRSYLLFFCVTGFSSLILQTMIIYGFEVLTHSQFGRSLIIIKSLYDSEALEINVAKATAVLVGMVWNFILYKYVIFKKSTRHDPIPTE